MRIDHVKPGIGFIAKRQSHTKTARGLLRMSNQFCSDWCKIKFDMQLQRILKLEKMLTNHLKDGAVEIRHITEALSNVNWQVDVLKEQVDRIELK